MTTKGPLDRLVWVKWVDSASGNNWVTLANEIQDAETRPMSIESVGWVVADLPHRLALAMSKSHATDCVAGTLFIPKVAIVQIMEILG